VQLVQLQYGLDDAILSQRTLYIRVGEADVRQAMDRAVSRIRRKAVVPGFRKGKAPAKVVRAHHSAYVENRAFEEIRQAAMEQIVKKLEAKDRPFLPTEVVDRDSVRLAYGKPLEFSVQYLVDPSGMSSRPEQPGQQFNPLAQLHARVSAGPAMGIPGGPALPAIPSMPTAPAQPQLPAMARPPKPGKGPMNG
jgi:hypothetical protein